MGVKVRRKFKRNITVPSDPNGVRIGDVLHRIMAHFMSPAYDTWYRDQLIANHHASRNRQAAHWNLALGIYLFTGLAEHKGAAAGSPTDTSTAGSSNPTRQRMMNRIVALANKLAPSHAGNDSQGRIPDDGNSGWGWAFADTHLVFHSAFGPYLVPEAFAGEEDKMQKVINMLKLEADGQGFGLWGNQHGSGNSTGVTITAPPNVPGARRATAGHYAPRGPKVCLTDTGAGYDPDGTAPVITLVGGNPKFGDTETRNHDLIVNPDGSVRIPSIGTSQSRRNGRESYADDLSWRSWPAELACGFFRHSENRSWWFNHSKENRAQMIATPDDLDDTTVIDGKAFKDWIFPSSGTRYPCYEDVHLFHNHQIRWHIGYTSGTTRTTPAAAIFMLLGGGEIPEMYSYNIRQVWRALTTSTNISNLRNTHPEGTNVTGGPPVAVRGRPYQIQRRNGVDYGEVNWTTDVGNTDTVSPKERTETARRGNYAVWLLLSTYVKLFTDESNAQTFEDGFLNSVEDSFQNNVVAFLPRPYRRYVGNGAHNVMANAVRDIALAWLAHWAHERKPFEKMPDLSSD